jgi:hypothetical protein
MSDQEENSAISAVHGLNHIFNLNHNKFSRVFWSLAVIASFCGFCFYLRNAWTKLMYEPEILIKTRERNAEEFPFPAITIFPNVFASYDAFNQKILLQNTNISDEKCEFFFSNLLWYDQARAMMIPEKLCSKEKLSKINTAEIILKSAIKPEGFIHFRRSSKLKSFHLTSLSNLGPGYSFNQLSFSELFNTEIISDDFKQFRKFLRFQNGSKTNIEDTSTWSSEKWSIIKK